METVRLALDITYLVVALLARAAYVLLLEIIGSISKLFLSGVNMGVAFVWLLRSSSPLSAPYMGITELIRRVHDAVFNVGPCPNKGQRRKVWCMGCYLNLANSNLRGHLGYRPTTTEGGQSRDKFMKRPVEAVSPSSTVGPMIDAEFAMSYPIITEYLVTERWDDGKPRESSGLGFTVKGGAWQLALNDKALKTSCYTAAESISEALRMMESALRDGSAEWRPWKRGK